MAGLAVLYPSVVDYIGQGVKDSPERPSRRFKRAILKELCQVAQVSESVRSISADVISDQSHI